MIGCCAYCRARAALIVRGQGGDGPYSYRGVIVCDLHQERARAWAARAGPVTVTPFTGSVPATDEPTTLF